MAFRLVTVLFTSCAAFFAASCGHLASLNNPSSANSSSTNGQWQTLEVIGQPTARHEAALVAQGKKLYLLGGRRLNPTDVFDIATNTWQEKSKPPLEIHHFQPVVIDDAIYIIGAMTGGWPEETPLDRVLIYYPQTDTWALSHSIPEHRRRGGAGAVVHNGKIYLVGGIVNGHMNGYQPWLDEYNPKTGEWKALADAPNARDHFQAAIVNNKLYAFAGRTTSKATEQDMALTIAHGNIYDFQQQTWLAVTDTHKVPTLRAGNSAFAWGNELIIAGGESDTQESAFSEVEAFNTETQTWTRWPALQKGRHGTSVAVVDGYAYTASGAGNRGGGPELTSIERIKLPPIAESLTELEKPLTQLPKPLPRDAATPTLQQWHTLTLNFEGPSTHEQADNNPFLHYRLTVEFSHQDSTHSIRGYYAADGNAAETSADAGNIWQVKFTPPDVGHWSYAAKLERGENIALASNADSGANFTLKNATGSFTVTRSDKETPDFRASGRLGIKDSYFYFPATQQYWLKTGTNSPENLLGYVGFDGTYRMQASEREGEATATSELHTFAPHVQDWQDGDLLWHGNKGKGIVGLNNYLAAQGMNASYFLTMNIGGDGKDVWPYTSPEQFERFDVSRLAQWELLFQYMQAKGILLHVVTQETENERLLDDGDTGPLRQLYYRELIARFGHHLGLVWNLGEENGPAEWAPPAQNDEQRKAMAKFIKTNDPYQHPVLLHTHSHDENRVDLLTALLGDEYLDGLSLQEAEPKKAAQTIQTWKEKSKAAGKEWLITMDEIGPWFTGAASDTETPGHPALIKDVLWGSLLSGAAGVEWYFGAKTQENDLTAEDLRLRHELWQYTRYAKTFFEAYVPWWELEPAHSSIVTPHGAIARKIAGTMMVAFVPPAKSLEMNMGKVNGKLHLEWFNPLAAMNKPIQSHTVTIQKGEVLSAPFPHNKALTQGAVLLVTPVSPDSQ